MNNTAAQPGLLHDINDVSRPTRQQLEPRAASADSSAARERADDRDAVVDRDGRWTTTSFAARIAVVTADDSTTKNDADHRSDSNSVTTTTASNCAIVDSTTTLRDWLWAGAGNRRFLNRSGLRRDWSGLDCCFGSHFDRSLDVRRRGLVLRHALRVLNLFRSGCGPLDR